MSLIDEINKATPLAESRGFEIGPQNVNGDVRVLLERKGGLGKNRYYGFSTTPEAAAFLRAQPELPHFDILATFGDGTSKILRVYEKNSFEATAAAAKLAKEFGRDYRLKGLEIL